MAKGQTVEELYIGLGLDATDLKLGFDTAGKTVKQAMGQLNNQVKNIRLKTEIDLNNLGAAASELDRMRVKYESINQLIDVQAKKEKLLAAQLKQAQEAYSNNKTVGNEIAMNRATTALLAQQKEVSKLQAEYRALGAEMAKVPVKSAGMFDKLSAGAGNAKKSVSELTSSFTALTGKAAAIMAFTATAGGLFNITDKAMNSGEALYKLSDRLHTTTSEAGKLNKIFKMAGVEIDSAITYFTKLDKQATANGKAMNATQEALYKYNISLTDSKGNLLSYTDQLKALSKGYRAAAEAGMEEEFAMEVLGNKGQGLIPVLNDMNTYAQALSKVPSTGLLDANIAHDAYIEWQALGMTMGQISNTTGAALLPIARELMPEVQSAFAQLVKIIKDNKDAIKEFGEIGIQAVQGISMAADGLLTVLNKVVDVKNSLGASDYTSNLMKQYYGDNAANKREDLASSFGGPAFSYLTKNIGRALNAGYMHIATDTDENGNKKSLWEIAESKYKLAMEQAAAQKAADAEAKAREEEAQKAGAAQKASEIAARQQELAAKKEEEAAQKAAEAAEAQKAAAAAVINVKLTREADALANNALTNNLNNIDYQADDMRAKGADEINITRWQEAQKAKIIEDFNREVARSIDSIWNSEYQNRLNQIEEEKKAWEKKGLDEVKSTEWAEKRKQDLQQDTALRMFKEQYKYLKLYRNAMAGNGTEEEKQLRAQAAMVAQLRKDAGITGDMWTTKSEIAGFQNAYKSAQNGIVPILDGVPQFMIWKGNQAIPALPEAYNNAMNNMESGVQVIRGNNGGQVNFNLHVTGDLPQNEEAVNAMADKVAGVVEGYLQQDGDTQYTFRYGG